MWFFGSGGVAERPLSSIKARVANVLPPKALKIYFSRNLMESGYPLNWLKRSVAVLGSIFFVTFSALGAKGYEEALPRLTVKPKGTKKYRKVNKQC